MAKTTVFLSLKRILYGAALSVSLGTCSWAVPAVSSVTGTVSNGQTLTIACTGAGEKTDADPLAWSDFEVSTNPVLSRLSSWSSEDFLGRCTTTPHSGSGVGCSEGGLPAGDGLAVGATAGNSARGQKFTVSVWRRVTYDWTAAACPQWKWFRTWNEDISYPDFYIGTPDGDWRLMFTEDCGGSTTVGDYTPPGSTWSLEEYFWQGNSAEGASNGVIKVYQNGSLKINKSDLLTDCSGAFSGTEDIFFIEDDFSNCTPAEGTFAYIDNLYMDDSWAQVIVGNASTLAASTVKQRCIPSAWSDTEITCTFQQGDWQTDDPVWLYVMDDNMATSSGFALTVGEAGEPPAASEGQKFELRGTFIINGTLEIE